MSYLIIQSDATDMIIVKEISTNNRKDAKHGIITIVDLETNEFYVENDVWQKIPER